MKKYFLFCISFFSISVTLADPGWLTSNMKHSDCENVFWKTQGMCFEEYNRQQMVRVKAYLRNEIRNASSSNCKNEEVLKLFEEREKAWEEYGRQYCSLMNHCIGPCGSGYSSVIHSCQSSRSAERLKFLENEVQTGLDIYGCPINSAKKHKILDTENYEVSLFGNCETGLFFCDDITYNGKSKKKGNSIQLSGKAYTELNQALGVDIQKGYIFKSEDIHYSVSIEGVLKVVNTKSRKILIEEHGKWR